MLECYTPVIPNTDDDSRSREINSYRSRTYFIHWLHNCKRLLQATRSSALRHLHVEKENIRVALLHHLRRRHIVERDERCADGEADTSSTPNMVCAQCASVFRCATSLRRDDVSVGEREECEVCARENQSSTSQVESQSHHRAGNNKCSTEKMVKFRLEKNYFTRF